MKKQLSAAFVTISAITLLLTGSALAHVVVKPGDVLTGAFQTFTMGVPNEKDNPTTAAKILIPDGLQYVAPTVKPGWTISVEKDGEGEEAKVKSITWTGGSIPAGQRDDFTFSAKAPDKAGDLQWKAYQTYEDGTTIAWDQDPSKIKPGDEGTPFSVTKVAAKETDPAPIKDDKNDDTSSKPLAIAALAIALLAFAVSTRKSDAKTKKK